jgi:ribosomal-protein-alanine N-acetyltransferase
VAGFASPVSWMRQILDRSPEAAQWLPEGCELITAEPVGFLAYRKVAEGEYEILNLAVDPAARRQGVGRRLVEAAIALGGRWFLEVRESNIAARRLYDECGFRPAGRRPRYYSNPPEDAIVLIFQKC